MYIHRNCYFTKFAEKSTSKVRPFFPCARGKSSESGGGEEIVVVVVVVKQNDYSRGVVNAAVAANCNVFRDAPQVQLREFSGPGFFPPPHTPQRPVPFRSPVSYVFTAVSRRWHTTFDWQFRGVLWRDKLVTTCLIFVRPLAPSRLPFYSRLMEILFLLPVVQTLFSR